MAHGHGQRRLALFGLLGLFIALASDLFRLTSTHTIAPAACRTRPGGR